MEQNILEQSNTIALQEKYNLANTLEALLNKNPDLDKSRLKHALEFTDYAHRNQFRKSGAPYVEHPLEVSKILAEYHADNDTVIAGLLHDVVEDTQITLDEIKKEFNETIAFMVDAVTKITVIQEKTKDDSKVATYRKMLTSMAKDPRILIIKIADRLHNMRTLHFIGNDQKRKRISQETLEVYAPLSQRFGLYKIKNELEDLSLSYLHHDIYQKIIHDLDNQKKGRQEFIRTVVEDIKKKIKEFELDASVQGRPKTIYSIYNKIKDKQYEIDNIFDVFALRVITKSTLDCYQALGIIHQNWSPLESRFKDYIASPKPNLYQSIHTTILGPEEKPIEVQIRTEQMNESAERGFAAHWKYKRGSNEENNVHWMHELVDLQREIQDSKEYLEFMRGDLQPHDLRVFTPDDKAITLPIGSTVLDFAYALHSDLGDQCIGAKINNHFCSPRKVLNQGDQIKVLRNKNQRPTNESLDYVKTSRAKTMIRKSIRNFELKKTESLGKTIFERYLIQLDLLKQNRPSDETLLEVLKYEKIHHLHYDVGMGLLNLETIQNKLRDVGTETTLKPAVMVIDKNNVSTVKISGCCTPLPGDPLRGFFVPQVGICLHHYDCANSLQMEKESPNDVIPVMWIPDEGTVFDITIDVYADDRDGLLMDIVKTFQSFNIYISQAKIETLGEEVKNRFIIQVHELERLNSLLIKLRSIKSVKNVTRF